MVAEIMELLKQRRYFVFYEQMFSCEKESPWCVITNYVFNKFHFNDLLRFPTFCAY